MEETHPSASSSTNVPAALTLDGHPPPLAPPPLPAQPATAHGWKGLLRRPRGSAVAHLLASEQGILNSMSVAVPRVPRLTQQAAVLHTYTHTLTQRLCAGKLEGVGSREPQVQLFVFTAAFPRLSLCKLNKDVSAPGTQHGATRTCSMRVAVVDLECPLQASTPSPLPAPPHLSSCSASGGGCRGRRGAPSCWKKQIIALGLGGD